MDKKLRTIDVYLGEQIKVYREIKGLSQTEFAKSVNLSRTSICNIEVGRQSVSLELLYRMTIVLGCQDVTYFLPAMSWFKKNQGKQVKKVITYEIVNE